MSQRPASADVAVPIGPSRCGRPEMAVVGGGPGGTSAALELARAGVPVTLFRPSRPGEKPCGGAVPAAFLPRIEGFEPPAALSVRPPWIRVENAAGDSSELVVDGLEIFRRADFDRALERAAVAAGARLVDARVEAIAPEKSGVAVRAGGERYSFGWLIGADGARGISRRASAVGIESEAGDESVGLGASIEGEVPDRLVLSFPDAADAYCWIFPRPGGCSVGIAYDARRLSDGGAATALDRFLERHVPSLVPRFRRRAGSAELHEPDVRGAAGALAGGEVVRERLAAAPPRRVHRYRYPIPLFGPSTRPRVARATGARILLVGDAAGVADPLTREGIRWAIVSGRCAAWCLIGGRPEVYADRLEAELGPELGRARRAAGLFFDDPVAQWMVPFARLHPGIRAVLGDLLACRQPYSGLRRRLLRAAIGRYACEAPRDARLTQPTLFP